MKYLRYAMLSLVTLLSALVGIFAGMWSDIKIINIFHFYLWVHAIIVISISAGFAFGGYKLTRKVIR
jgi:uncharacterized protein YneF (UPF0154 family)